MVEDLEVKAFKMKTNKDRIIIVVVVMVVEEVEVVVEENYFKVVQSILVD